MKEKFILKIWPRFFFHKHSVHLDSFYTFSNYRRIWIICIFLLTVSSLIPLILATVIHYRLIHRSVDSELVLRAERLTSNARRSITFFINERLDALGFIVNEMAYSDLTDNDNLEEILNNLKLGFGGYNDLSVINAQGKQIAYAGPFNLEGKDYHDQSWFNQSLDQTNFVSEVFTGYRDAPHIIVAVKSISPSGSKFLLRATLDTERLIQLMLQYKNDLNTDIFLVNHDGILQTPSLKFGNMFTTVPFPIPSFSLRTEVETAVDTQDKEKTIIMGSSYIKTDKVETPFILIVRKERESVMSNWLRLGDTFKWIVGVSAVLVFIIVILSSSFLVNKLYMADKTKAQTMLQMEESQQLASIGQLAAGVAHEVNNPLAQINETAGYIKDMYQFEPDGIEDEEVINYLDEILDAVERCGAITSQLLGFVRQFDLKVKQIDLKKMISSVLDFHKKESEYRNIHISKIFPELPVVLKTDSGKLQQVLVNLVNNAFQALEDDGCLDVSINQVISDKIEIVIKDTGCGIPKENISRIQEPFFSTKKEKMGTGLGLSITYGLVKKLHGNISVESSEGVGTIFTVTLPMTIDKEALT
jgi:two-component system NtrC family sensor kinase